MTPEKEFRKGGSRLAGSTASPSPQKPSKKRTSRQKAMLVVYIVVTVLAALVVLGFVLSRLLFVKPSISLDGGRPELSEGDGTGGDLDTQTPGVYGSGRKEDFFTFLVIGRDTGGGGNTDTLMLASYDVPKQKLSVMSIPRDTMVNVSWDIKKINSVYNVYGGGDRGIDALDKEISQLVGFVPDFQVVVEWDAVGELVDAIGGVWFEVPRNMNYDDPTQDLHIHIDAGYQLLDGEDAMGVIRYRHDNDRRYGYADGDLGRIKTQQAFLKAVVEQCLQIKNVTKIQQLAEVFNKNVTTNLTIQNLLWFGQQAIFGGLEMENVNFVTMPCSNKSVWSREYGNMQSYVVPNTNDLVDLVNEYFNPYLEDLSSRELDIMYVNADGTIGSSTGRLEDTTHNAKWLARQSQSSATPPPAESEGPVEETTAPVETAPVGTESPEASDVPSPSPDEGGGESALPPLETPAETTTPSAPPSETPAVTPSPSPVPVTESPDGPPEGIPIL